MERSKTDTPLGPGRLSSRAPASAGLVLVPLTQAQVAVVDAEDVGLLQHKWYAQKQRRGNFYAGRAVYENGVRTHVEWLHVAILGAKEGFIIDHKDGNTLDCRRKNLRHATQSQNRANSRKRRDGHVRYLGVYFDKRRRRYIGKCCLRYKHYSTAYFRSAKDCARARDALALRLHGTFAKLNFTPS